ncbi:carboxymuconolactone decarboxylase family protein [Veillonella agrestimuris]|uniref:carboxymuconolactone decarboxylase family protein n=1 Tax=Veillonella agrestimuris TaxID=2941340 RepID=UPI002040EA6A|nr:carboxymuconolactone decarboxylase family protein [Veillonella agrestimuris]
MKRLATLGLVAVALCGTYVFTAYGAPEPAQAPPMLDLNRYTPKDLNARHQDLVAIGQFTALGNQDSLRAVISDSIERGRLTPTEVGVAIRQLYSAAGLKRRNEAVATFEQLREDRPEFGVDYDKFVPRRVGFSALLDYRSEETSDGGYLPITEEGDKHQIKYNTFRVKKPKPQNFKRSGLGTLDKEIVTAAALGTRVGTTNVIFESSKKNLSEMGLNAEQIEYLESMLEQ